MDLQQAARLIEWLDEERRRDKATIALLEERVAQQADAMIQLERRLNGLEGEQAVMRTSFLPAGRDSEMAEQLRTEFQQLVEEIESKRLMAEREGERRQDIGRESLARMIRDLGERTDALEKAVEELPRASSVTAWPQHWRLSSSVSKTWPRSWRSQSAGSPSWRSNAARTPAASPTCNRKCRRFRSR